MDKVLSQGQSAIEGTALRLPQRLEAGDKIGIVSTSSPVQADHVSRTRQYFEERGYRVCEGEHVLDSFGYMAGTAEARARDFNAMLNNPDIRMIVTARGGESAIQLLPLIEYGTLALDPKIICALSDPSILLNALTARSAVPTFHGPNGYDFGSEEPIAFTEENFWPLVTGERKYPHTLPVQERMKVLREGPAVNGWLWGGHMGTISGLLGTNFLPRWAGGILFLEEFIVNFPRTDALMTHFRLAGVFDRIRALVIGEPAEMDGSWETYAEIILRNCDGFSFPIVANVPLGHTPDKITLPIGGKARLDTAALRFELLEAVVI